MRKTAAVCIHMRRTATVCTPMHAQNKTIITHYAHEGVANIQSKFPFIKNKIKLSIDTYANSAKFGTNIYIFISNCVTCNMSCR